MNRQFMKYAQFAMLFILGLTGAMFAQGTGAAQAAPATRFGLPAAKPATTVATQPAVPATTTAPPANQPQPTRAAASIATGNTSPLSVSAATVVLTQQGVTSSTSFRCSRFVFNATGTPSLGSATTGVVGKTTWDATFTKPWDAAPDPFFMALLKGDHFDSVSFTFVSPAGQPVYTIALKMVFIKSIDKGFDASTGAAVEEISLIFGAFKMQDAAGNSSILPTVVKGAPVVTTPDAWFNVQ